MRAKSSAYLNKHKPDRTGQCPISIRITYNRERKYYLTGVRMLPADFEKPKSRQQKEDIAFIDSMLAKAITATNDLGDAFSFELFEKIYLKNRALKNTILSGFEDMIAELDEERTGAKQSYECSMRSFQKFKPNAKLSDVTPRWLQDYEKWMLAQGRSKTTIGFYTRDLRTLFNKEIADGNISREHYPFGRRKYEPPTGKNVKKAMDLDEISKIFSYRTGNPTERQMCDYWKFIYLCNGINVADFCNLKHEDVNNDEITFVRQKTKRTKRVEEPIIITLPKPAKDIIKKYGTRSLDKCAYLFSHFQSGMTPEEKSRVVANLVRLINDYMKGIAKKLEIKKDVTTYYARHSFATIMLNNGVPVPMISKMLGHGSIGTTENYFGGFEKEQVKKAASILLDFKKAKNA